MNFSDTLYSNGTKRNKLGIKDKQILKELEYQETQFQGIKILKDNPEIQSLNDLKKIHKQLFENVYDWAGEFRTYDMQKNGHTFQPYETFPEGMNFLNNMIKHINHKQYVNKHYLAVDLGGLLSDLNELHPFREGNGRSQRIFMQLLSQQKGYRLHLGKDRKAYQMYLSAAVHDDRQEMQHAVEKSMTPIVPNGENRSLDNFIGLKHHRGPIR
ncbi:hypothetical protein BSQ38_01115 [Pediococcus damnosus]|uniref:Fic/DOC family protein n=1 Tax=Pediococcus damnosus TaxID=51663 RepID=UPI000C1C9CE6|nr:Fic family protein [Pediococcus damnosus]PIO80359.1 hypothetical protein BSQ38_01115 [Pediococcus damnosus]